MDKSSNSPLKNNTHLSIFSENEKERLLQQYFQRRQARNERSSFGDLAFQNDLESFYTYSNSNASITDQIRPTLLAQKIEQSSLRVDQELKHLTEEMLQTKKHPTHKKNLSNPNSSISERLSTGRKIYFHSRKVPSSTGREYGIHTRFGEITQNKMSQTISNSGIYPSTQRNKGITVFLGKSTKKTYPLALGPGNYTPRNIQTAPSMAFQLTPRDIEPIYNYQLANGLEDISIPRKFTPRHRKGISFSNTPRVEFADANNTICTLGPGKYESKNTDRLSGRNKGVSFTVPKSGRYPKGIPKACRHYISKTHRSFTESKNKFQQFSTITRFKPQKNELISTYYSQLFDRKKPFDELEFSVSDPINRNLDVSQYRPQELAKSFDERVFCKRVHFAEVLNRKKEIFEAIQAKRIDQVEKTKARGSSRKEFGINRICEAWESLSVLGSALQTIGKKYEDLYELKQNSDYYSQLLIITCLMIGKIIRKNKEKRLKRFQATLKKFVYFYMKPWLRARNSVKKTKISKAMYFQCELTSFGHLITFILSRIKLIQKFYRRLYTQNKLITAFLNYSWSLIEPEFIKDKYSIKEINDNERKRIKERIKFNIKKRITSNEVPLKIRLLYINQYLKEKNGNFTQQYKDYLMLCKTQRIEFYRILESQNSERMLKGLGKENRQFERPPPPRKIYYINRDEMISLVNIALINRSEWDKEKGKTPKNVEIKRKSFVFKQNTFSNLMESLQQRKRGTSTASPFIISNLKRMNTFKSP